jgi:phospholipase C
MRRQEHIQDLEAFYDDMRNDTLPAVCFVKPSGINDGHPASSRLDIFEAFARRLVTTIRGRKDLWANTAIFITFDEGGGYWDSGYVQPLDFFGDGTRVPLIIVSPYATGGRVVHSYTDHVSILKFIERNWSLKPLTSRSRDNLPNPETNACNPYLPVKARPSVICGICSISDHELNIEMTTSPPHCLEFFYFDAGGGHRSAATALRHRIGGLKWSICRIF